jgi:hypothetical protein
MLGNSLQVSLKIFLGLAGRRLPGDVEPRVLLSTKGSRWPSERERIV